MQWLFRGRLPVSFFFLKGLQFQFLKMYRIQKDSWYANHQDRANENPLYKRGPDLPIEVIMKLTPIFQELSTTELLKTCVHGHTRNLNESLNVIIWKCILRSCYVILPHLELGVFEVATNFNVGLKASLVFYKGINLTTGKYSFIDCRNIN